MFQEGCKRTIPFYKADGSAYIMRHRLNARRTGGIVQQYKRKIQQTGIISSCRGEAWMIYDESADIYYALTYGTLPLVSTINQLVRRSVLLPSML